MRPGHRLDHIDVDLSKRALVLTAFQAIEMQPEAAVGESAEQSSDGKRRLRKRTEAVHVIQVEQTAAIERTDQSVAGLANENFSVANHLLIKSAGKQQPRLDMQI